MSDQRSDGEQQAPDSGEPDIESGAGYGDHAEEVRESDAPAAGEEKSA